MEALLITFKKDRFTNAETVSGTNLKDVQKKALFKASNSISDAYLINDYLISLKPKPGKKWKDDSLFRIITEDLFKTRK